MIVTVNINPAIDRVLWIGDLSIRGTIRAKAALDCIGGKGADTSLVLSRLGAEHLLVSFLAGEYGKLLEKMYEQNQINSQIIWKSGETRVVTVIIETEQKMMTQISQPGFMVSKDEYKQFMQVFEDSIDPGDWVIAAGSLPAGVPDDFYASVTDIAHRHACKVLVDTAGIPMSLALQNHPDLIKCNSTEFALTFGNIEASVPLNLPTPQEVIREYHLDGVVITNGADGIELFVDNLDLQAHGPVQEVVNAAGAGDAVSAGLVYRLSLGDSWQDALRWACAAGTAVVTTEATADCNLDAITNLIPQIKMEIINDSSVV
jgi:1-phosphofructokinase family hexose kinase